jgi:MFS transporter, DHA1 family, tetracycline resistance protein
MALVDCSVDCVYDPDMDEAPVSTPPSRAGLVIVYLTVFIDLLGFGIILPSLPFYAERFGATGIWVGAMMASYSAAQLFGASVLGRLSDRIGRRPVLLLSLFGSAISLTLSGLADSLAFLIIARALAGLFGGSIPAAQAFIADLTPPFERAKYMGMLGASIGMGFVFGPGIGAALIGYGFGAAAFVAAGLAAANLLFALALLKESRRPGVSARRVRFSFLSLFQALGRPGVGPVLGAMFLSTLSFVFLEATYALFGERMYGLTPRMLGILFTAIGIVGVIVQGGLVGRLVKRMGEARLAMVGAALTALMLGATPYLPTLSMAAIGMAVLAVGQGFLHPTLPTLLSRETNADEQGGILGLGQSLSAAARAIGPVLGGWLFDMSLSAPYLAGGVVALGVVLLVSRIRVAQSAVGGVPGR